MGKIVKLQADKSYNVLLNKVPGEGKICSIDQKKKEKLRKNIVKNTKSF